MTKLGLVFAVLFAVGCNQSPDQGGIDADEAAIRDLIRRSELVNNSADTLGWVALFEPGAVYMPPGSPAATTEAELRAMAEAGFGGYQTDIHTEPLEIVILGDWSFARSAVTGIATSRTSGDAFPVDVKQLVVYHRQPDGSWKIARLMNNGNS